MQQLDYYEYFQEDYECPDCGSTKTPFVEQSYECSDADGNRGIWVRWVTCVECGYDEGYNLY